MAKEERLFLGLLLLLLEHHPPVVVVVVVVCATFGTETEYKLAHLQTDMFQAQFLVPTDVSKSRSVIAVFEVGSKATNRI